MLTFDNPGNGPSGISLSLLLSGHWPHYTGAASDEFLHARLMDQAHLSLVEQDLEFLTEVKQRFYRHILNYEIIFIFQYIRSPMILLLLLICHIPVDIYPVYQNMFVGLCLKSMDLNVTDFRNVKHEVHVSGSGIRR